jgi:beta-lactamase regulating signal transducer with metallopeptidase domain
MNAIPTLWLDGFGAALAAVLNTLWIGAAVAAAAWVVLRQFPRINAATRYAIWWAVLAAVVAVPAVSLYGSAPEAAPQSAVPGPAVTESEPTTAEPAPAWIELSPQSNGKTPQSSGAHRPPAHQPAAPATPEPITLSNRAWIVLVLAAWLAVLLFRMVRIGRSYLWVRAIKRRARRASREQSIGFDAWVLTCGVDRPVRLLLSSEIASPMAVGFARPAVILPETLLAELSPAELDHILLHELAHIARRDDWTNLLARLAGAVFALHPVALWVVHRIDREREPACDDWVVAQTGEARPYASSLTRMFELSSARRELLASGMAEEGSRLSERVERLLERGRNFEPEVSMKVMIAGTLVLFALVVAGSQSPGWVAFAQEPAVTPAPAEPPAQAAESAPPTALEPVYSRSWLFQPPLTVFARGADERVVAFDEGVVAFNDYLLRPSLLQELTEAGYTDLTVDEIIEVARSGLSVQAMSAYSDVGSDIGWTNLSRDQMIELMRSGVSPAFVAALKENGFTAVTPSQAIQARRAGLSARDLGIATAYRSDITLEDIIKLKRAGAL